MYPWLVNGQNGITNAVNAGFDNAAIASQLSGIQTNLTTGFSNAEVTGCNRAMDAMQTAYTNQIAELERSFASQTATAQGFNNLASQMAQCLKKVCKKANKLLDFTKYEAVGTLVA